MTLLLQLGPLRSVSARLPEAMRRVSFPAFAAGLFAAYFLAAKLGIATSLPPEGIVILWPPNAIVLAVLVSSDVRRWPAYLIVIVAAEVAADLPDYPLLAALGYGLVNFFEAALAAALIRRFVDSSPSIATLRDYVRFLLIGPLFASGSAALLGAGIYKLGNPALDYLHYWRVFWLGDALGLLVLGSLLLTWRRCGRQLRHSGPRAHAELSVLLVMLLGVSAWAFFSPFDSPRVYLLFPLLIWAALRFAVLGASGAVAITVAMAIGSAVSGYGPFVDLSDIARVPALQGLIAVVSVTTLMLAFASDDARRVAAELAAEIRKQRATEAKLRLTTGNLARSNAALDQTVASRTKELRQSLARNELLLKEVHHRVKNNLQLVSSLLSIYSRRATDPGARAGFAEVQGQVQAIASAYELITQMESADEIDLSEVVPRLCRDIGRAAGPHVRLNVEAPVPCPIRAEAAVAVALATNELVTNAFKHHRADGDRGIDISCRREDGRALLTIADDGPGFPEDFDLERDGGFGIRMVCGVVAQAGGSVRLLDQAIGARVEISFDLADGSAAA